MTSAHAVVTALLAAASSSNTKTNANPIVSLLPLILIFGVAYVFFLRPRSQAARRQRDTLMDLSAGDEVLTGAGIFGTVLDVEADRVTLETAPGTRITVLRSTIARKLNDPGTEEPNWDEHDEDEAHGAYHDYEHDSDHEHEHEHEHDHDHTDGEPHPADHDADHPADHPADHDADHPAEQHDGDGDVTGEAHGPGASEEHDTPTEADPGDEKKKKP